MVGDPSHRMLGFSLLPVMEESQSGISCALISHLLTLYSYCLCFHDLCVHTPLPTFDTHFAIPRGRVDRGIATVKAAFRVLFAAWGPTWGSSHWTQEPHFSNTPLLEPNSVTSLPHTTIVCGELRVPTAPLNINHEAESLMPGSRP